MSGSSPHDCSGDAAAYVLGALEPAEAEAFARHMESCVVCRDEVAAFEGVVDTLPSAVPQYRAPRALRRRVLRQVRDEARERGRRTAPSRRRPWLAPRVAFAGAGALAAAVIAVVIIALGGGGSSARTVTATVAGVGSARVRVVDGRAELILTDFPAPPSGDVYEVWLQHGTGAPSPTRTLFSVNRQGAADIGITGPLDGVDRVLVTAEHAGGSLVPTHSPVIVAPLT